MRKIICNVAIVGCLAVPLGLFAASEPDGARADKDSRKEVKADQKLERLAKKIQKEVAKDDSLQPSSRDIEVTVQNRVVSLKGTVQSDEESQAIQGKAESLLIQDTPWELVNSSTGEVEIQNDLTVAQH